MLINDARSMLINDPGFWRQRAEEARRLAARMTDEMAKQDDAHGRGRVRQVCYRGGHVLHLRACPQFPPHQERRLARCRASGGSPCRFDRGAAVAASRHRREGEELTLRQCRLLAIADSLMRFGC